MSAITRKAHDICFGIAKPLCAESTSIAGFQGPPPHPSSAARILLHTLSPSGLRMQKVESTLGSLVGALERNIPPVFLFPFTPHPTPILFSAAQHSKAFIFSFVFITLKRVSFGDTNFSIVLWRSFSVFCLSVTFICILVWCWLLNTV